jgi:hypothetical protein
MTTQTHGETVTATVPEGDIKSVALLLMTHIFDGEACVFLRSWQKRVHPESSDWPASPKNLTFCAVVGKGERYYLANRSPMSVGGELVCNMQKWTDLTPDLVRSVAPAGQEIVSLRRLSGSLVAIETAESVYVCEEKPHLLSQEYQTPGSDKVHRRFYLHKEISCWEVQINWDLPVELIEDLVKAIVSFPPNSPNFKQKIARVNGRSFWPREARDGAKHYSDPHAVIYRGEFRNKILAGNAAIKIGDLPDGKIEKETDGTSGRPVDAEAPDFATL